MTANFVTTVCSRCEGVFKEPDIVTTRSECVFCGFGNVVKIKRAGYTGTQRTADSVGDASAATSITVT